MRGDGIGPEIVDASLRVIGAASRKFGFKLEYSEVPCGDNALKEYGNPLPPESIDEFSKADACLKGPVGETVMDINTKLRFGFDLYANIRPARSCPGVCPPAIRPDIDMVVIRENSEGFYRALENEITPGVWTASGVFTENGARRIAKFAFDYAEMRARTFRRRAQVTLATKANIFRRTHGLYLKVFQEEAGLHPNVDFTHYYADAMCARMVREPQKYDVVVSENLIADLLSDLAGQVAGGLGMTPGTNINYETKHAYFEPTHGSAPDIVGKDLANPIGQIRSGALMLEYLGLVNDDNSLNRAAIAIEEEIASLLNSSNRAALPREIGGSASSKQVAEALSLRLEPER
jgi:3-isopropylmalate dehydrogenase